MSTEDDTYDDLINRLTKLTESLEAGDLEPEEYERQLTELRENVDVAKQDTLKQFSESLKPYLENNIPLEDPLMEVNVVEGILFSRLHTHCSIWEDPDHPSGFEYPPYFTLWAAALNGASHAYSNLLTDPNFHLEGGYGIHNTNAFRLIEEGYDVSHDDYISQLAILTMPLINRFLWMLSKINLNSAINSDQWRRSVIEMYYDYIFDEPDGSQLTEAHSNICLLLYEILEEDIESEDDENLHTIKVNEAMAMTKFLTENIGEGDTQFETKPSLDDVTTIGMIISIGMWKSTNVLITDWPQNWPYEVEILPTDSMFNIAVEHDGEYENPELKVPLSNDKPKRRVSSQTQKRHTSTSQSGSNGGCLSILIILLISTVGSALGGYLIL